METCKAVVQEGPRKGNRCKFQPEYGEYCGRHLRNKEYDEGIAAGKKWCRFFFRGCDSDITNSKGGSCPTCKARLQTKFIECKHEGCIFKIKEGEYCKKHERDMYRNDGNRYCDIDRGCFTILTDTAKTCDACLEVFRARDSERYAKRKEVIAAATILGSLTRSCMKCNRDFEPFLTRYAKESVNCKECSEKQKVQDTKRQDRIRNYMEERKNNLKIHYKHYINGSLKRGYGDFQLDFDQFSELVQSPCHYCTLIKENEVNGIDRINNSLGYTKENCVSACWKCNRMKYLYHPVFFIEKCKIILKEYIPLKKFYSEWTSYYTRSNYRNYNAYKHEAESRTLPFNITQDQWNWLTRSQCYLCGYQDAHGIGLDRVDNTIRSYTFENSRPCCGSCNMMKGELSIEELLEQCKRVSDTWPTTDHFKHIPTYINPLKKAEDKGMTLGEGTRTHWKSNGLYYAIISNNAFAFQISNKDVYTVEEFNELCELIPTCTYEKSIEILKKLLVTIKKRRVRLNEDM